MTSIGSTVRRRVPTAARQSVQQRRDLAALARRETEDEEPSFGSFPSTSSIASSSSTSNLSSSASTSATYGRILPRFPLLQFPAPVLTEFPRESSNSLRVTSSIPLETVAHTFAIVRAVEKECSNTVVDIRQWKRRDTPGKSNIVHLVLLYPVEFPKNNPSREIRVDLPRLASITNHDPKIRNGGPTLQEVEAALNPPSLTATWAARPTKTFSIQVELNPPQRFPINIRAPAESDGDMNENRTFSRSRPDLRLSEERQAQVWAEEAERPRRDEQAIVEVLGKWKGRYGGFKSLQKVFEGYKSPQTERMEVVARLEEARLAEERAEKDARRAKEVEREQEEREERSRRRAAAKEQARLASETAKVQATSTRPIEPRVNTPKPSATPSPNPTHVPKTPTIRPSEKRLMRYGHIASASSTTHDSSATYSLASQQGKVDALRQEAWQAEAERQEAILAEGQNGFTSLLPEFMQKGLGLGKK